jgi:hypothetical protein
MSVSAGGGRQAGLDGEQRCRLGVLGVSAPPSFLGVRRRQEAAKKAKAFGVRVLAVEGAPAGRLTERQVHA